MADEDKAPLGLPTTFTYSPETCTVTEGTVLEVGPSDLVFFRATSSPVPGTPAKHTFVVLRRTNP